MPVIRLRSNDGELVPVNTEIAEQSLTIRTMLEDSEPEDDDAILPLPEENGAILRKVISWCTHHMDNPVLPNGEICSWDAEFLNVNQGALFDLIKAAVYLDIKGLMDVTSKRVANMINGKTVEEIRQTFKINNNLPPGGTGQLR